MGLVSPAVVALNKGDVKGFAKFSMKHDWNDLKIEYSKAVSFCNNLHQQQAVHVSTQIT